MSAEKSNTSRLIQTIQDTVSWLSQEVRERQEARERPFEELVGLMHQAKGRIMHVLTKQEWLHSIPMTELAIQVLLSECLKKELKGDEKYVKLLESLIDVRRREN